MVQTDVVFRALNDPSRRLLLDRLFERDGQTLRELCDHLPGMTRFGVMNHLKVLGQAGLVTTARAGRATHHYLNPVPIQLIHDRWIDKFTAPMARSLSELTTALEHDRPERGGSTMTTPTTTPTHVYETYIRCQPADVWRALIEGDQTVRYYFGTRVESDWQPGSPVRYLGADGQVVADGEILAAREPERLEMRFHPRWDPVLEAEGAVHMVWLIDQADGPGGPCRVRVEYHDLDQQSRTFQDFSHGLPRIVAGLKTLLETGEPLTAPA